MSDEPETDAVQKWLGLEPFVLLTVSAIEDDGSMRMSVEFGGGVTQDMVPALLGDALDALNESEDA